ncbi:PP2C family protein-serine/threonine phosphatase [candidate division KSB1 bacterium]
MKKNIEYLKTGGLILGYINNVQYTKGTAKVGNEDIFLLYTDGVTEAMNLNEEEFGEEHLIKEILTQRDLSSREIKQGIISSIAEFTLHKPQSDDITLMIIKKSG